MSVVDSPLPDSSSIDVTVAIPTYNGGDRIPKVLDRLRSQVTDSSLKWEVIVVDNNSSDNTADVVKTYQESWSGSELRYCFEPKQGLAYARQCAVENARGTFVGFLDDDTLPAPDWVAASYAFGQEYPQAGAFGGQVHGEFEAPPPENFERIESFFAIKKRGSKPNRYEPEKLSLPAGAGLVVRRQAWLDSVPAQLVRTGRGGNDFEISLHLHRKGWEIWYCPTMHIYHQIPPQRLERESLLKLIRTAGLCIYQLRVVGVTNWQKPIIAVKIMGGNLRRIVLHLIKYRGKVKSDLIAECEMTFFISSLISPFYSLKASLDKAWSS
ncbi:glycosyltransferase family 2 protein [Oscillatoria sp. FACHB-1407]|uniref:hormogonium polysaccharide biosynthesis glycosyltransferase HpsE n=1 Tax=Oscillatoria sp. FACHB-1407 TaxID=2692847 RepID=UPI001682887D|nr:hormogonium polysaccharide biosynthesis glycosyltransferase HpsE [Oscillatoria sp. FACHB-1407]MBD2464823.1 glycosyltransferase family 2 protein [Oscillatoria sp. FACHB-1407]